MKKVQSTDFSVKIKKGYKNKNACKTTNKHYLKLENIFSFHNWFYWAGNRKTALGAVHSK